jgi:hypothetical protein
MQVWTIILFVPPCQALPGVRHRCCRGPGGGGEPGSQGRKRLLLQAAPPSVPGSENRARRYPLRSTPGA